MPTTANRVLIVVLASIWSLINAAVGLADVRNIRIDADNMALPALIDQIEAVAPGALERAKAEQADAPAAA